VSINVMGSTVLAVTDLTAASYKLVGFASFVAGPSDGEVVLVSSYGGGGTGSHGRLSEPPPGERVGGWRRQLENRLRQEGQLLEQQRQWCADRGVRCRAELYEEGHWPDFVLQSAERSRADLILVGTHALADNSGLSPAEFDRFAADAPCPVSLVRLPPFAGF
jgi:nucleotide-binding universal stress UspA family protein